MAVNRRSVRNGAVLLTLIQTQRLKDWRKPRCIEWNKRGIVEATPVAVGSPE